MFDGHTSDFVDAIEANAYELPQFLRKNSIVEHYSDRGSNTDNVAKLDQGVSCSYPQNTSVNAMIHAMHLLSEYQDSAYSLGNFVTFDASAVFRHNASVSQKQNPLTKGHDNLKEDQFLPLDLPFIPSKLLLDLWVRSLNSYFEEAKQLGASVEIELFNKTADKSILLKEFNHKLRSVIVRHAQMYRDKVPVYRLSFAHAFSSTFMARLAEEFLIRIDFGTLFFKKLQEELVDWLSLGVDFSGRWGSLKVDAGGDLILRLNKTRVAKLKGFVPLSDEGL